MVNGKEDEFRDGISVVDLLNELNIPLQRVAVQLNRKVIKKEEYPETYLKEGDTLEIVSFIGGG